MRGSLHQRLLLAFSAVMLMFSISTSQAATPGYTQTKYPIVLVHGLFGFDSLFQVYDYWYGITDGLRNGGATVYVAQVDQLGDDVSRGNEVIAQLDNLRAVYGYTKFNLIGHSQGGITIRYVASVRPDLVASATSVGTPHAGTPVADGLATIAPPGSPQRALIVALTTALGNLINAASGGNSTQNALGALSQLTTAGATAFNVLHPEGAPSTPCGNGPAVVNGIRYYSYGGTAVLTNVLDISDPFLAASSAFFAGSPNDGLVGQCSTHWGTVLRDNYPWNHLDEVNQIAGLRGLFAPDPVEVYRTQANRLQSLGL